MYAAASTMLSSMLTLGREQPSRIEAVQQRSFDMVRIEQVANEELRARGCRPAIGGARIPAYHRTVRMLEPDRHVQPIVHSLLAGKSFLPRLR